MNYELRGQMATRARRSLGGTYGKPTWDDDDRQTERLLRSAPHILGDDECGGRMEDRLGWGRVKYDDGAGLRLITDLPSSPPSFLPSPVPAADPPTNSILTPLEPHLPFCRLPLLYSIWSSA